MIFLQFNAVTESNSVLHLESILDLRVYHEHENRIVHELILFFGSTSGTKHNMDF